MNNAMLPCAPKCPGGGAQMRSAARSETAGFSQGLWTPRIRRRFRKKRRLGQADTRCR